MKWGYLSEQFSHKPRFVCSYWKTHYYLLKADVGIPYLNKSVILDQLLVIQVGPIMGNPWRKCLRDVFGPHCKKQCRAHPGKPIWKMREICMWAHPRKKVSGPILKNPYGKCLTNSRGPILINLNGTHPGKPIHCPYHMGLPLQVPGESHMALHLGNPSCSGKSLSGPTICPDLVLSW